MPLKDQKFLVVDDHFLSRQMVASLLKEAGINAIDAANDGAGALDKIRQAVAAATPYAVVFLDWSMPNMNGFDVLTTLRADPQFDRMAIIMLTAESEDMNILKVLQAGATAYMPKPITADALSAKLADLAAWFDKKTRVAS